MTQPNLALSPPLSTAAPQPSTHNKSTNPTEHILGLLRRAAELCVAEGVGHEAFMAATWSAVLDASPGLREKIADQHLVSQLTALRDRGQIGTA